MSTLRFLTAGESHGPSLTAILEGIPAGLSLRLENINRDLARRQVHGDVAAVERDLRAPGGRSPQDALDAGEDPTNGKD